MGQVIGILRAIGRALRFGRRQTTRSVQFGPTKKNFPKRKIPHKHRETLDKEHIDK